MQGTRRPVLPGRCGRLATHVRFEERELFEVAQMRLGDEALDAIADVTTG